jgi:hypothetical protein
MWKALLLNPSLRLSVLDFLTNTLPKPSSSQPDSSKTDSPSTSGTGGSDDTYMCPTELVLNALMCGVQDKNSLVQRAAMDLILSHFKLDKGYY